MYNIEKKNYGIKLTFSGFIQETEMAKWYHDFSKILMNMQYEWNVFIDMRYLKPLPKNSKQIMEEGQKLGSKKGVKRSVVILNDPITTFQFKGIAKKSGLNAIEKYIDASKHPNWEKIGLNWIERGINPE